MHNNFIQSLYPIAIGISKNQLDPWDLINGWVEYYLKNKDKYIDHPNLKAVAVLKMKGLLIDHFRKSNRMPTFKNTDEFDIFSVLGDGELNVEKQLIKEQILSDLRRLVEELPEDQKEVLIMRMYKDMSFKEIAESTGVSINTALGRMRYSLINMRKLIEKHNIVLVN